ncbi:hypothetical protein N7527_005801 [Penicillium freii]|nr:hypothetical protein N7527_005801 [Penicillium freii]
MANEEFGARTVLRRYARMVGYVKKVLMDVKPRTCDRAGTGLLQGPGLTTDQQCSGWNQHEHHGMEGLDLAFDLALDPVSMCSGTIPDEDPCVSGTKCS